MSEAPKRVSVPGTPNLWYIQRAAGRVYYFRYPGERTFTRVPGFPDFLEAKRLRNQALGALDVERVKPTSAKFVDVAEAALANLEKMRRSEGTMAGHRLNLRVYLKRLHNVKIQEIDRHTLIALVVRPMEDGELSVNGRKLSGSTIHNAMMTASVVFEYAIDCKPRLVTENPVRRVKGGEARPSRKSSKGRVVLTAAQFETLLENATGIYRPLFGALGLAGLRISEALNLEWGWVDFETRLLWPNGTKTELSSEGSVQLSRRLSTLLAEHKMSTALGSTRDDDYVFVTRNATRFSKRNVQRELTRLIEKIQKTDPAFPTFSPHALRHTYVSHLLRATGGDVALASQQARHSNPAVTQAVYQHEISEAHEERRAADAIDAALGGARR